MQKKLPILVSIPHSSSFVPADLKKKMLFNDFQIRKMSDLYTDEIFNVPNAHIVKAGISRLVADVNRAPDDIEMEYRLGHEGVVVSVDEFGAQVYKEPPEIDDIFRRVEKYHDPFHQEIEKLSPKMKFLIDGHSLWSIGPDLREGAGKPRKDIVIGNREFTSCSRFFTSKLVRFFADKGFSVSVNDPYPGKYILGYHCSRRGLNGIQLELNRKLFMNERTLTPKKKKIRELHDTMIEFVEMIDSEFKK